MKIKRIIIRIFKGIIKEIKKDNSDFNIDKIHKKIVL